MTVAVIDRHGAWLSGKRGKAAGGIAIVDGANGAGPVEVAAGSLPSAITSIDLTVVCRSTVAVPEAQLHAGTIDQANLARDGRKQSAVAPRGHLPQRHAVVGQHSPIVEQAIETWPEGTAGRCPHVERAPERQVAGHYGQIIQLAAWVVGCTQLVIKDRTGGKRQSAIDRQRGGWMAGAARRERALNHNVSQQGSCSRQRRIGMHVRQRRIQPAVYPQRPGVHVGCSPESTVARKRPVDTLHGSDLEVVQLAGVLAIGPKQNQFVAARSPQHIAVEHRTGIQRQPILEGFKWVESDSIAIAAGDASPIHHYASGAVECDASPTGDAAGVDDRDRTRVRSHGRRAAVDAEEGAPDGAAALIVDERAGSAMDSADVQTGARACVRAIAGNEPFAIPSDGPGVDQDIVRVEATTHVGNAARTCNAASGEVRNRAAAVAPNTGARAAGDGAGVDDMELGEQVSSGDAVAPAFDSPARVVQDGVECMQHRDTHAGWTDGLDASAGQIVDRALGNGIGTG
ncbi:Uncharacterised protein [Pseudomonas aeruginosa]|nr:Uncharacterised protein [Pseudomonas aeruginosa]